MQNQYVAMLTRKKRTRLALALGLALGLGPATAAPPPVALDAAGSGKFLIRSQVSGDSQPPTVAHGTGIDVQPARSTAATIVVTNCNDTGTGSLRKALASANSGDTIDISGLDCTIKPASTLFTDGVSDMLTIKGNPDNTLAISGENAIRPLTHQSHGTIRFSGVSIKFGRSVATGNSSAWGGCIHSEGTVVLDNHSVVSNCHVETSAPGNSISFFAAGGGVWARYGVSVTSSTISNNTVKGNGHPAKGGGIWSSGDVTLLDARISGNTAETGSGVWAVGGGVYTQRDISVKYSSIEDNTVSHATTPMYATGGGAWVGGNDNLIANSTISGNTAGTGSALILGSNGPNTLTAWIFESTIANNTATHSISTYGGTISLNDSTLIENSTISGNIEKNPSETKYGAGITIADGVDVAMYSTVVSKNFLYAPSIPSNVVSDIVGVGSTTAIVTGSHNMYGHKANVTLPGDSIQQYTPGLGPLADNGGPTRTMAVLPGSPLIDAGDDKGGSIHHDQRGPGFVRVYGAAADIGAFELGGDIIFVDGFD